MSKRTVSSFQMTEADARKFDALEQAGFGSRTDIIRTALDRMYIQEIKTMNAKTTSVTVKFVAQSGHAWEEEIAIDELDTVVEQQVEVHGDIQVAYTIDENGSVDKTLYRME